MNILREKQRACGAHRLQCSSAPDTSGVNAAALANVQLSKDALDWYQQQYADQAPLRDAAAARSSAISDAQLAAMQQATNQSQNYWDYQTNTFRPLEQKIVSDAEAYDTPARREQAAAEAMSSVGSQADQAREATMQDEAARGVDPSSGNAAIALQRSAIGQAAAQAAAGNNARKQIETIGAAKMADAANLGRNIASNQATQASLALTSGNSSAQNAQTPVQVAQSAANQVGTGYNTAINGNTAAGNLYGQIANIDNTANNSGSAIWGALGTAAGLALSDKNAKKNGKRASPKASLAAIKKTPVSNWQYKAGRGDGGSHVGPMAQAVRANMGEGAAPGGKVIDLVSMNGHTMNAIKAIDKRVASLESVRKPR